MPTDNILTPLGGAAPCDRSEIVRVELERILASATFRHAKRSQELLRYVVTNHLAGNYDALRERAIGTALFQKPSDYNTSEDSGVRVKASELRKRLAQFYMETGLDHPVIILLPTGSYVPEFRWAAEPAAATEEAQSITLPRRKIFSAPVGYVLIAAAVCVLVLFTSLFVLARGRTSQPALDKFWRPVFDSEHPVVLCVASPVVFESRLGPPLGNQTPNPPPSEMFATRGYVGRGDALSLAALYGLLLVRSKTVRLRMADDISFVDLRNSPVVLIGAYTNQWTMTMTRNLRFAFQTDGERDVIQDRKNPSRHWDDDEVGVDYALISRVFNSRTGEVLIAAAGLGHSGTQTAGEVLTSERSMEAAFRTFPRDWARHNVQVVLKVDIVRGESGSRGEYTPGLPKVVATHCW